jgi:asparagine synthase (glutamine-hydrolysing)
MCRALAHRGPDAEAIVELGPLALGHRRLSVIDPTSASDQPMADATGRFSIAYNGEVYNFRQLRRDLEAAGMVFRTAGDTEVVLAALARWGRAGIERLNGMFAFAFWDAHDRTLLLARDRAGEKPLFYSLLADGGVAFASEPQALASGGAVLRGVDPLGLGQFLALGYTVGTHTLHASIQRLEPATALLIAPGRPPQTWRYWDLIPHFRAKRRFRSSADAVAAVRAGVDKAVTERLVSDVPLGAFLSGGIDSSTVVASMARAVPAERVRTFTMGFGDRAFDEVAEARIAADHIGVCHRERIIEPRPEILLAAIDEAAREPLADTSAIPTLALCQFAREQVTVCLSGDGGDELFAGYETYVADRLHRTLHPLLGPVGNGGAAAVEMLWPASFGKVGLDYKLRQFLAGLPLAPLRAHHFWRVIADIRLRTRLLRPEWHERIVAEDGFAAFRTAADETAGLDPLDQALYVDIKTWLDGDILVKVDRMSMARSLETRAPFLDPHLMELAASLPPNLKLRGRIKKWILKQSQSERLPAPLIHRRKSGFNAPVGRWLRDPLKDVLLADLTAPEMAEWFDPGALTDLHRAHVSGRRDHGFVLLALMILARWFRLNR